MASKTYALNFVGDVMLGRLIDQLLPQHVDEPSEADIVRSFRARNPQQLAHYGPESPWGDVLDLFHAADLNLVNLETSATTSPTKWPDKMFNYRMHPANVETLKVARVHYAGLANNHTLDFCEEGLLETARTVKNAGIAFAGAGESGEEALRPAVLHLPGSQGGDDHEIHVWAASDHPSDWAKVKGFHFIDYTAATRERLRTFLNPTPAATSPALKIFSIHWGPNYSWRPSQEIRDLAHFLIDDCGIDIVHGHSSHHVQGVEKYHGKLVIYGCGDFVDDYALVQGYRNDLSGVWSVQLESTQSGELKLKRLEMHPTKIERFAARRLKAEEPDSRWVREKIKDLSAEMGTEARVVDSNEGRVIVDLS